jgi:hypothetical protein
LGDFGGALYSGAAVGVATLRELAAGGGAGVDGGVDLRGISFVEFDGGEGLLF